MEARSFQDVDTCCTDPRNSEAAESGILYPRVPISPTRLRTGKPVLTVPKGARPCDMETGWICAIHSNGNLLVFGADEVLERDRGKGLRLLGIPGKKFASGWERMVALSSVPEGAR